ncbi:hypothetical protein J3458_018997 [Metarhizium acridum]|uniref:uncharacterized protein n=1 Tax=Metarhizium acridum TaxID=92637 RepID=UPI001C6BD857|nr:hypothetical protein J3458_018997 [Metarhizium acridum]
MESNFVIEPLALGQVGCACLREKWTVTKKMALNRFQVVPPLYLKLLENPTTRSAYCTSFGLHGRRGCYNPCVFAGGFAGINNADGNAKPNPARLLFSSEDASRPSPFSSFRTGTQDMFPQIN